MMLAPSQHVLSYIPMSSTCALVSHSHSNNCKLTHLHANACYVWELSKGTQGKVLHVVIAVLPQSAGRSAYEPPCLHAAINSSGKYLYLGSYDTQDEAARIFDRAAVRIRGTKARLNFRQRDYIDPDGVIIPDEHIEVVLAEAQNPDKPKRARARTAKALPAGDEHTAVDMALINDAGLTAECDEGAPVAASSGELAGRKRSKQGQGLSLGQGNVHPAKRAVPSESAVAVLAGLGAPPNAMQQKAGLGLDSNPAGLGFTITAYTEQPSNLADTNMFSQGFPQYIIQADPVESAAGGLQALQGNSLPNNLSGIRALSELTLPLPSFPMSSRPLLSPFFVNTAGAGAGAMMPEDARVASSTSSGFSPFRPGDRSAPRHDTNRLKPGSSGTPEAGQGNMSVSAAAAAMAAAAAGAGASVHAAGALLGSLRPLQQAGQGRAGPGRKEVRSSTEASGAPTEPVTLNAALVASNVGAAAGGCSSLDMFGQIQAQLPLGAALDCVLPASAYGADGPIVGVLYSLANSQRTCAAIWNSRLLRNLGTFDCEREAKQSCLSVLELMKESLGTGMQAPKHEAPKQEAPEQEQRQQQQQQQPAPRTVHNQHPSMEETHGSLLVPPRGSMAAPDAYSLQPVAPLTIHAGLGLPTDLSHMGLMSQRGLSLGLAAFGSMPQGGFGNHPMHGQAMQQADATRYQLFMPNEVPSLNVSMYEQDTSTQSVLVPVLPKEPGGQVGYRIEQVVFNPRWQLAMNQPDPLPPQDAQAGDGATHALHQGLQEATDESGTAHNLYSAGIMRHAGGGLGELHASAIGWGMGSKQSLAAVLDEGSGSVTGNGNSAFGYSSGTGVEAVGRVEDNMRNKGPPFGFSVLSHMSNLDVQEALQIFFNSQPR